MGNYFSFDQLCGGAVLERFRLGMAQITRNIVDPNTDPEKNRTLTIKLTLKPDKSRRSVKTSVAINISLAPPLADETVLLVGQDIRSGRIEMTELGNNNQSIGVQGESVPVKAEVVPTAPPVQSFDPETGEIYGPPTQGQAPIDLRAAQ